MNNSIHYKECPVCESTDIKKVLLVKDHSVSYECFEIWECKNCSLRFTQDIPDESSILTYYQSEEYISHSNTSKGLINRLYQFVRKRTLRKKRKLVEKISGIKKGKLLDIGSGIGAFVNEMKKNGWDPSGVEPDEGVRVMAKKLYGADVKNADQFYDLPPACFDVITAWHVLEHVHDLHGYMQQLKTILKEKGILFIAVPNYTSKDAAIYKEYWAAYDVPRHLYHFSPHAMQILLEKNGLNLLDQKPMWYDSFYISMLSSKYKNGKTKLLSSFFNGLRSNVKAMGDVKRCSSVIYVVGKKS